MAVGVNGLTATGLTVVVAGVIVKLFELLSTNELLWQVNNTVLAIAVNGVVGGVKLVVYTAEFTTRRLDMYPVNQYEPGLGVYDPIVQTVAVALSVDVSDAILEPLTYAVNVVPFLTNAM